MDLQNSIGHKTHGIEQRPPFRAHRPVVARWRSAGFVSGRRLSSFGRSRSAPGLGRRHLHRRRQQRPDCGQSARKTSGGAPQLLGDGNRPGSRDSTLFSAMLGAMGLQGDFARGLLNQAHAFATLMDGAAGFFTPRPVPPFFSSAGSIEAESFYDVSPLKATLERLVDFDRINTGAMRFSVGAVNVRTGNFEYFRHHDPRYPPRNTSWRAAPCRLAFRPTRIDGECYWDGGLISNTPLQWVLDNAPRQDTLAFQVDLWSASGEFPRDLLGIELRAEGYPLLEPHTRGDRPVQVAAAAASRTRPSRGARPRTRCCQADPEIKLLVDQADEKGLQHRPAHISRRRTTKRARPRITSSPPRADHGGALGLRLQRRPSNTAPPRGAAAAGTPDGVATFRLRLKFHQREEHDHEDRRQSAKMPSRCRSTTRPIRGRPTRSTTANLSSSPTGPIRRPCAPSCRSRSK